MLCAIDVLFNFAIIILSTSVVLVFFPIFLFGKLFVGCQRCSGSPPLPVARNTGLPFTTRSWLHRFPIHHQLMATQGPFIAVASYTGFPFVIKGQTDRVPFNCQWLATMGFHLSAKTCYMYTQGSHYQQWLATQVSHLLLVAIHSGFNLLPAATKRLQNLATVCRFFIHCQWQAMQSYREHYQWLAMWSSHSLPVASWLAMWDSYSLLVAAVAQGMTSL